LLHASVWDWQRVGEIFVTALEVKDDIIGLAVFANIFYE
jgi:hypothetical protein